VVWSEGMYLGPHHFQVQSRYFEDSLGFAISTLWYASYGLAGIDMDPDALLRGEVAIRTARGIFPDGLLFNMPESDAVPVKRPIGSLFPPTRDSLRVLLAIPPLKSRGVNCMLEPPLPAIPPDSRYVAESAVLQDDTTGLDERPVRLGRKAFRLIFETEPSGDLQTLPVARVTRDNSGRFAYDPHYVPPVVQLGASVPLLSLIQRLVEILEDKSANISKSKGSALSEFASREIANFWLLHSVNAALTPLRHHIVSKRGHPEELYVELARLAGALCTFGVNSHPRNLPDYDHENLGECFEKLDSHIRAHLETVVPSKCITIPLRQVENYFFEGEIPDERVLGRARWVFGLRASAGESEVLSKVPQLVKLCTPPFVRELVRRALPGMALTHLPMPPPSIPMRVETQYFGVNRSGPCWDHMVQTRRVGVYIPGEFPSAEAELYVILDT
jgi:type VI secretion system protein ImpJ